MIDTHAHLDSCADPADEVIVRAHAAGVETILTVGSGLESCRTALALAERFDRVYGILGIHPHQASEATQSDLEGLAVLLAHPRAVAVGETGLDFYRDYAPRDVQRTLFAAQCEIAVAHGKALVVHSRAADDETLSLLVDVPDSVPVILHCFSSPGLLPEALERGYYVSFAGNITYPKAADLRRAASCVAADRLLGETDSPYLAPQRVRGRPNEPANVMDVLATLAEARGAAPDILERHIQENAARAFGIP